MRENRTVRARTLAKWLLRGTDRLLSAVCLIALLAVGGLAAYIVVDTGRLMREADSAQYRALRPDAAGGAASFGLLVARNPEVVAWLTLEDTGVDYPVTQGKNNQKYINTSALGEFSLSGAIFADARNAPDFSDTLTILYGHNMTGEAPETARTPEGGSLLGDALALLLKLGWIALVLALALVFVVGLFTQRGDSMDPAFQERDIVLFFRLDRKPEAGEAVVFRDADGAPRVGRAVAVAGDTVEIDELGLKINGFYQDEPYVTGQTLRFEDGPDYPLLLGEGEVFVLFDVREAGGDSRSLGPLEAGQLLGRVMLLLRHRGF